ncbi:MAG: metallophosphoesterase [Actinobacteria bacterium]|nr:metallophosphoesterase [Actinomycetota bacterium]
MVRLAGRVVMAMAALVLLIGAWGVLVEPRLIAEARHDVVVPGVPPEWDGEEVAFLSDLQVGMFLANTGTARRMVERLVSDPPAAVLLGGDFVYGSSPDPAAQVDAAVDIVRPLPDAGIPTYAVLGNHDVQVGATELLSEALARAGIELLDNQSVPLPLPSGVPGAGGAQLHLVGVGPHRVGGDRPAAAVATVPDGAPRIVFMHHPASFPALPAGSAPLAVAGHTHGGQMRVPFTPEWSFLRLIGEVDVPVDGWAEEGYGHAGNRLYVSRGVGFSRLPMRINCPPELTVFRLRRE